ncbi:DUF1292 domain-containing protein [Clostridium weizhouense]|uniref:DUF1292 domain-containing protein n=1 Tax=Clostridium weizhouense TaxID=2859781 RepID=A0ABS7AJL3_9CLOT|nr:DUF1292 domain-containing protein [Clostridium weizhouense]MBW6408843.1 DUF1292 domain-containing protein [Clostridium weizhouense]
MNKDMEFINGEKDYWGKIYTDIAYAISEISPFLSENKLKSRKYYIKSSVLQDYIKLLDSAELDVKKVSFLSLFKTAPSINKAKNYKIKNQKAFKDLEKCAKCTCLNCAFDCKFKSCSSCRENSYIHSCDKERVNVRKHDNFIVDLTNNDTGCSAKYRVLATIEDCILDKQYILLENIINIDDKLVLYYYPGIKETSYGEITDAEEFDFIVETYQSSDY